MKIRKIALAVTMCIEKDCNGCSDYTKYVENSETVYNHLIGSKNEK